jgi:predicted RNase H-like HicB family nuclease
MMRGTHADGQQRTALMWTAWRPADPQSRCHRVPGNGDPDPEFAYLRCSPVPTLVLDVVTEPARDRGCWYARWRGTLGCKGRAESVQEAQECAFDAAENMLGEALEQLEAMRVGHGPMSATEEQEVKR